MLYLLNCCFKTEGFFVHLIPLISVYFEADILQKEEVLFSKPILNCLLFVIH